MAKTKISEWSATPANNTDIDGINIAEGCAPSGINDAIREMMAQVKDLYAGTSGDATAVAGGGTGATTASAARTNLGLAIGTDVQAYNANLTAYGATGIGFRNRIINGDMRIDQRNNGASVTANDGVFAVDRFRFSMTQASKGVGQRSSGSPAGFTNSLLFTSTAATSLGSGDQFAIVQPIEGFNIADLGWGTASAQTVTLSFWVRSSLTGTFGGSLQNQGANRSYPFAYAISAANTWEQKTITIAGDTTGTWNTDNSGGIRLFISLGMGSTSSGTAGAWAGSNFQSATGAVSVVGTNGATFNITGVQLEAGSVATPFERRDYGRELMMCQRYLPCFGTGEPAGSPTGGVGIASSTTLIQLAYSFKVTTRVPPTGVLVSSASHFTFLGNGSGAGAITFSAASTQSGVLNVATTSASSQGAIVQTTTSTSAQLQFTGCEL